MNYVRLAPITQRGNSHFGSREFQFVTNASSLPPYDPDNGLGLTEEEWNNPAEVPLRGEPDFNNMAPALAELARQQHDIIQADLAGAGDLKDISFRDISQAGWDIYDVRYANTSMEWSFILGADEKISGLHLRPSP